MRSNQNENEEFSILTKYHKSDVSGAAIGGSADLSVVRQVGWRYTQGSAVSQGKTLARDRKIEILLVGICSVDYTGRREIETPQSSNGLGSPL